ncbi:hypothetical protein PCE1_001138 [Barthelona sp. PCE]
MVKFIPIKGYLPTAENFESVCAPPYDVLNSREAYELAGNNPKSFLNVTKPEISIADFDYEDKKALYKDDVYAAARINLEKFIDQGLLVQSEEPTYYVYSQQMGDHVQYGIIGGASTDDYDNSIIKLHEKTRQCKEDDRVRHVQTTGAHTGPVFLTYEDVSAIDEYVENIVKNDPVRYHVDADGVEHRVWFIEDPEFLLNQFQNVPFSYVADGHHRAKSASRVAASLGEGDQSFLAVMFPATQLKIIDYNRVLMDFNGHTAEQFIDFMEQRFEMTKVTEEEAHPTERRHFSMFIGDEWFYLKFKDLHLINNEDPVASLDTQILTEQVLTPFFGIEDLRTANNIKFVGGTRGYSALSDAVKQGDAVAFGLFPVSIQELMSIADAGKLMPPKSTWFVPKLASGVCVNVFDHPQ